MSLALAELVPDELSVFASFSAISSALVPG